MNIRLIAPLSLALATGGFAFTLFLPDTLFVGILRSFCEAAMVGGLADWFAVVALFRKPLRLPIPHTAIIPRNRVKIEQAIVGMVNTLLPPETIIARITQLDLVGRFIAFWGEEAKKKWLVSLLGRTLHSIVEWTDMTQLAGIVNEFGKAAIAGWAPRISKEVSMYLAANYNKPDSVPEKLFDFCIQALSNFVESRGSADLLKRGLEELLDNVTLAAWLKWFGVLSVQELSEKLLSLASEQFELETKKQRNLLRDGYKKLYKNLTRQLRDPRSHTSLTLDRWWDGVINGKQTVNLLEIFLAEYRADALEDLEADESKIKLNIEVALAKLVESLKADDELRNRASMWVNHHFSSFVRSNHGNIAQVVRNTLEKNFSNEKLVSWIEDKVGADLQYIRLNGALVGGLVGVAIFLLHQALR